MRYFIHLAYDGTNYHGWQLQPNATSVQAVLNEALSTILRHDVSTTGAGRTDTGVSAAHMVAHFDDGALDLDALTDRLNKILPPDIAIKCIHRVADRAHARFDAISRTYHYDILLRKDPFARHHATRLYFALDFARMNEAAQLLLSTHDFSSFCKAGTPTKTNICTVSEAFWKEMEPGRWRFRITADRFLRNMVRAVVGTLIQVGRGRLSPADVGAIMARKDRSAAGDSVPPEGLSLVRVAYDEARIAPSVSDTPAPEPQ